MIQIKVIQNRESKQRALTTFLALLGASLLLVSGLARADLEDDIRARLAPAGEICVMGDECAAGLAVAAGNGEPKDPEEVYNTYCMACHDTGANNSPVLGDAAMWEDRIAKGVDVLYENAINGFNNDLMPPRGLCVDCSDDDLKATVDYMLDEVR